MFHLATSELTHFLTTYGYWAVLFFVAIESAGIPFPGETMLLVVAIYAGTTHRLAIQLVIAAAASGAILVPQAWRQSSLLWPLYRRLAYLGRVPGRSQLHAVGVLSALQRGGGNYLGHSLRDGRLLPC